MTKYTIAYIACISAAKTSYNKLEVALVIK